MKSKRIVALGSALVLGTTTALAGLPTFVYAQEETETVQGVQTEADKPAMFAAVPDITIPAAANNIALGKTVTSSSNEDNNLIPGNLVDGSGEGTSRWSSALGAGPHWVQIDLGESHTLEGVNLFWESGKANRYSVKVSEDGNTWTDAYKSETHPSNIRDFITFAEPVSGRYVKLYIDSISQEDPLGQAVAWETISLYEIQVLEGEREPADKSALQEMYDSKKGLEPVYNTNTNKVIEKYNAAVEKAGELLRDDSAKQDEVDKATAELEKCWYFFVVEEMNYYYSPYKDNFDYDQYVTESILPLIAVYEEADYNQYNTTENLKQYYDKYLSAKDKVEKAPENPRGMSVGLNPELDYKFYSQIGQFTFEEYLKSNEDGSKTPMLRITYVYDRKSPITGEEVDDRYQWSYGDLKESEVRFSYTTYDGQSGTVFLTDYLTKKDGDGFVAELPITFKGEGKYTVEMYTNHDEMHSLGYYYTHEYENAMEMNKAPVISTDSEEDTITLQVGAEFDPLSAVKVVDEEDGEITLTKENVIKNDVNTAKAGTYHVTYRVTDENGASAEKTITVIVKEKEVDPPTKPEDPDKTDKPDGTDKPDKTDKNDKPASPKTGDPVSAGLAVSMLAGSTGALAVLFGKKRNKK